MRPGPAAVLFRSGPEQQLMTPDLDASREDKVIDSTPPPQSGITGKRLLRNRDALVARGSGERSLPRTSGVLARVAGDAPGGSGRGCAPHWLS